MLRAGFSLVVIAVAFLVMCATPASSSAWSWDTTNVSVKDYPGYEMVRFTGYCTRATTWNLTVTAQPKYSDNVFNFGPFSQRRAAGMHPFHAKLSSISSGYYTFRIKVWPRGASRPDVYTRNIFVW